MLRMMATKFATKSWIFYCTGMRAKNDFGRNHASYLVYRCRNENLMPLSIAICNISYVTYYMFHLKHNLCFVNSHIMNSNSTLSKSYIFYLDHNGLLEYFQFEPVSPVNNPECFNMPLHHLDDYKWQTPSPWDTQENFAPTTQVPNVI